MIVLNCNFIIAVNSERFESKEDNFIELPETQSQPNTLSKTKGINARTILWYMVFFGFAVDYMIRININITIVDMIIPDEPSIRNNTSTLEKHRISLERSVMELLKVR